jgi:hypothetical protein
MSTGDDDALEDPLKTVKLLCHDFCYKPAMLGTSEEEGEDKKMKNLNTFNVVFPSVLRQC